MSRSDLAEQYPRAFRFALKETQSETLQAAESMVHNLNTMSSRSGGRFLYQHQLRHLHLTRGPACDQLVANGYDERTGQRGDTGVPDSDFQMQARHQPATG